ncbi:Cyclin-dependent kinase 2 [Lachnellula arida]|uniref:Cyclin-dependent kinase 2 n=1 Tax=Lachnellula arida TaxID=1316785 RepID=A0A8T9BIS4_9HELO|nr:Cyclin-dependent kinase 2 [Lachnellula arida]
MESHHRSKTTIYDCARDCLDDFNGLCQADAHERVAKGSVSWAERQRARFYLWTDSLGVFASGHASADHRLRDSSDISRIIIGLVLALRTDISYQRAVTLNEQLPRQPLVETNQSLVSEDVEENGDSESLPSSSNESGSRDHQPTKSRQAIAIEKNIDLLITLARSIRRSGATTRDENADRWVEMVQKNDLEDKYTELRDFPIFAGVFLQCLYPHADEKLKAKIAKSMARRRNHFVYRGEHHKKLAKQPLKGAIPARLIPQTTLSEASANTAAAPSLNSGSKPLQTQVSSGVSQRNSGTSATPIGSKRLIRRVSSSSQPSTIATGASIKDTRLVIPPAPPFKDEDTEVLCPYCYILYPIKVAERERWRISCHTFALLKLAATRKKFFAPLTTGYCTYNPTIPIQNGFVLLAIPLNSSPKKAVIKSISSKIMIKSSHPHALTPLHEQAYIQFSNVANALCVAGPLTKGQMTCQGSLGHTTVSECSERSNQSKGRSGLDSDTQHEEAEFDPGNLINPDLTTFLAESEISDDDPAWIRPSSQPLENVNYRDEWGFWLSTSKYRDEWVLSHKLHSPQPSSSENALCAALFKARHEWPPRMNRFFIPNDELERLLHVDAIMDELATYQLGSMAAQESHRLAQNISNKAPRLFAILICLGLGDFIPQFMDEGIDDEDLPFGRIDDTERPGWQLGSKSRPNEPIRCMTGWKQPSIINFHREQWYVLAHIFNNNEEGRIPHYDIGNDCILPFVKDEEQGDQVKQGDFSTKSSPSMAVKRLHSTEEKDFLSEVDMLNALTPHNHPHLVRLLATYRYRNRYYLLFPFAKLNLREYWKSNPLPDFTESMILWSLHQCEAIASGLRLIHTHQTTQYLPDWGDPPPEKGNLAGVEDADRKFGCHGDIKPENILWSVEIDQIHDDHFKGTLEYQERGYLLIADLKFHQRWTTSHKGLAHKVRGSKTYEPPEMRLNKVISRAYDIWSLGCLYLEFITWMVLGWEKLSGFPEARGMAGASGVTDDTFYTIIQDAHSRFIPHGILRESVREWIRVLHEQPRSSLFIHDFLDLIEDRLLAVDPLARITCGPLNVELGGMVGRGEKEPTYLTNSSPWPGRDVQVTPNPGETEVSKKDNSSMDLSGRTWDSQDPTPAWLDTLQDDLLNCQKESPPGSTRYFVPINMMKSLVTRSKVEAALQNIYPRMAEDRMLLKRYSESINLRSKRVFAILITEGSIFREAIKEFVDEGITDDDLPFYRAYNEDESSFVLCKEKHKLCKKENHQLCGIQVMSKWSQRSRMEFDRVQWFFQAPEFRKSPGEIPYFEFHDNVVMPFLKDYEHDSEFFRAGGYSQVWPVQIDRAHQNLVDTTDPKGPYLAIKRLISRDKFQFNKEIEFSKKLSHCDDPHLIQLLATYKFKNQYHLVFPYAKENLREYWNSVDIPYWNKKTGFWFLQEICGLVAALNTIHNLDLGGSTAVNDSGNSTRNRFSRFRNVKSGGEERENKYGRHGDLKPENILRLEGSQGSENAGVLQITDFGLGRFHRFESRSMEDPRTIQGSPTYAPPEIALGKPVSRAYDIWSLGCIFLEFITWLLEGSRGLDEFSAARMLLGEDGITDDVYFTLITPTDRPNAPPEAEVREGVLEWIDRLRQHPRRSEMSLEFLDLIEQSMLKVDSSGRISAELLVVNIRRMLDKSENQAGYLLGSNESVIDASSGMKPPGARNTRVSKVKFDAYHLVLPSDE